MADYLDWCNNGSHGEPEISPEIDATNPPLKRVERGRSVTPRHNVNATLLSVEVVDASPGMDAKIGKEERTDDMTLGSCMFVPFVNEEEQREDEAKEHPMEKEFPSEDQAKVRRRDPAPSPPRFRGLIQHTSDFNEIEIITNGFGHLVLPEKSLEQTACEKSEPSPNDEAEATVADTTKGESVSKAMPTLASDDVSVSSLFDFLTDALSFVDSTASTQKASGARKNNGHEGSQGPMEKNSHYSSPNDLLEMRRSGSHSTMSTHSDISHVIEEEEGAFLGTEILDSVPENDVMDKIIVFNKQTGSSMPTSRLYTSNRRHLLRFQKQKPSKILKKNLKSLSVLVYGKRIARHNFMYDE
jgi:hypothetical protein